MPFYWQGDDLLLKVAIQANASQDSWVRQQNERWLIKVRAPAVEHQANQRLCRFLAQQFAVRQRQVILEQGHHHRYKLLRIVRPKKLPDEWLVPELQPRIPSV